MIILESYSEMEREQLQHPHRSPSAPGIIIKPSRKRITAFVRGEAAQDRGLTLPHGFLSNSTSCYLLLFFCS